MNGAMPKLLLRPVQKVLGARQTRARIIAKMLGQAGDQVAQVRRVRQDAEELHLRKNRPLAVVVLRHASGRAGPVRAHVVDDHFLVERGGARFRVRGAPVDPLLKAHDVGGGQPHRAVADATALHVEVLVVDGQRGKVVDRRRVAEPADLHHAVAALEVHDVVKLLEKRRDGSTDPGRADGRHLARRAGVERVPDGFPAREVGEVGLRELEVARQHVPERRIDGVGRRGCTGGNNHECRHGEPARHHHSQSRMNGGVRQRRAREWLGSR